MHLQTTIKTNTVLCSAISLQMKNLYSIAFYFFLLLCVFVTESCSTAKTNYSVEYEKEWKAMIKSQAWIASLQSNDDLVASTEETIEPLSNTPVVNYVTRDYNEVVAANPIFKKKYKSLVSRSYFKIITEAERADGYLKAQYEEFNSKKNILENRKSKEFKTNLEMVNKKYAAHSKMLAGLKSWNIFSEQRTGDLEYFKKENFNTVYSKYIHGENDATIINFLVYKLADLYHFEN